MTTYTIKKPLDMIDATKQHLGLEHLQVASFEIDVFGSHKPYVTVKLRLTKEDMEAIQKLMEDSK